MSVDIENNGFKTGCLICGKPIVYCFKNATYTCSLCGGEFEANSVCEEGHYVCDKCHSSAQEDFLALLRAMDEKDPGKIFRRVVSLDGVHMHGPEHHSIVPCVMLTAYRNNGGKIGFEAALEAAAERGGQVPENGGGIDFEAALEAAAERGGQVPENGGVIDFEAALEAAAERGGQVPGGICGFWGACGAAIGAGIFASVMADLTPYNEEEWGAAQQLTARCLVKIAATGGPRCCKRTSRMSIEVCVDFAKERYGVAMPLEDYRCAHYSINEECIHDRCPYY